MAKKRASITLPSFDGVEGKAPLIPEGEYVVTVKEVTEEEGQNAPYLKWVFESDHFKGLAYYNTSLAPQALWNLRGLLEAMGYEPPEEETDVDVDELVGLSLNVIIAHEEYNGKQQSKIVDYFPIEVKKASAKKASAKDDVEEKKEEEDDDRAARRRERRKERRSKSSDDDEKPAAKKATKSAAKKNKVSSEDVNGMDEEELGDIVKEYDLDCDLDDAPTLRKKRALVIKALEEGDHLED